MVKSFIAIPMLLLLAGCGDRDGADQSAVESVTPRTGAVAPEFGLDPMARQQKFQSDVVEAYKEFDEKAANELRIAYATLGAKDNAEALKEIGGAEWVRAQVEAAEMYYYLRPVEKCVNAHFNTDNYEGAVKSMEAVAASDQYPVMIADAERAAPEQYRDSLKKVSGTPTRGHHVSAAYEALRSRASQIAQEKKEDLPKAFSMLARSSLYFAAATDGKCVAPEALLTRMKKHD